MNLPRPAIGALDKTIRESFDEAELKPFADFSSSLSTVSSASATSANAASATSASLPSSASGASFFFLRAVYFCRSHFSLFFFSSDATTISASGSSASSSSSSKEGIPVLDDIMRRQAEFEKNVSDLVSVAPQSCFSFPPYNSN